LSLSAMVSFRSRGWRDLPAPLAGGADRLCMMGRVPGGRKAVGRGLA
jgi:hypothetical protein